METQQHDGNFSNGSNGWQQWGQMSTAQQHDGNGSNGRIAMGGWLQTVVGDGSGMQTIGGSGGSGAMEARDCSGTAHSSQGPGTGQWNKKKQAND